MHVVRVRPFPWAMKEGADEIVNVGNVNILECGKRFGVKPDRVQLLHRDLNIYDGLRIQPRNGSRAVVADAAGDFPESLRDSVPLRLKFKRPA